MKKSQILIIVIAILVAASHALKLIERKEFFIALAVLAVIYGLRSIDRRFFGVAMIAFLIGFAYFSGIPMGFFVALVTFLLVLGVLVYIHEAGHFITARRNGVTCHEFGFGFPPRIGGFVKDDETGEKKWIWGTQEYYGNNTLFSLNWIPLGGFVRIKGENAKPDQEHPDKDSFIAKSGWVRFKILFAGVTMNFILGWLLISIALMIGLPIAYDEQYIKEKIKPEWIIGEKQVLINTITPNSAAQKMGIETGDAIKKICTDSVCTEVTDVKDLVDVINNNRTKAVTVGVMRGAQELELRGILGNQEVGALGVSMAQTVLVKYPPHLAFIEGFVRAIKLTLAILIGILGLFKGLVMGAGTSEGVAGPLGIAVLVNKMRELGIAYLFQISAILSLNLAIFNALPIPALDGGRILFLFIEKIKGSVVNPKVEGFFHTVFFTLLILLMLFVTTKEGVEIFKKNKAKSDAQQEKQITSDGLSEATK